MAVQTIYLGGGAFGAYKTSYVVLLQQNSCKLLIYKTTDFWLIFIGCSVG